MTGVGLCMCSRVFLFYVLFGADAVECILVVLPLCTAFVVGRSFDILVVVIELFVFFDFYFYCFCNR